MQKSNKNVCKVGFIWYSVTCSFENSRYVKSIIHNSVITCDEIIETTKRTLTKAVPVNLPAKMKKVDL